MVSRRRATGVRDPQFSEDAIAFLRGLGYDPAATYDFELLSGAVVWSDEQLLEFVTKFCGRGHRSYGQELFTYRTSLLVGKPREVTPRPGTSYGLAARKWIGFRPECVTPAAHW